jgi:uncharacterized membrane protein YoaK (UPF0700 family)
MQNILFQDPRNKTKAAIALVLTFSAGIVDIVGYLAIYHMFVAHMTGATVHLGSWLVTHEWNKAIGASTTIISFVTGSVIGRTIIEMGVRNKKRTVTSMALLAEVGLISVFLFLSRPVLRDEASTVVSLRMTCTLLGLLGGAMGVQTGTLTRVGPLTVHTTFVTGMLNKLSQAFSQWLFWAHDEWRRNVGWNKILKRSVEHAAVLDAKFMLSIWFAYLFGSASGSWMVFRWNTAALYLPIALLVGSMMVDQVQPLSVAEEVDEP